MVCSKCGQECADDVKFCTNCGAELAAVKVEEPAAEAVVEETVAEETAATEAEVKAEEVKVEEKAEAPKAEAEAPVAEPKAEKEPKEKKPVNRKMAAIAAAALLLCCLIAMINSGGKGDYVTAGKKAIMTLEVIDDEVNVIYMDGKKEALKFEKASGGDISQDMSVACFNNEDKELVVIREGKVKETGIEEANYISVSAYGDTIAYMTDVKVDDKTYESFGTLNLYYTKNGKTKEIAEDVLVGSAVLSPNGETVAFVSDYDASDDFKGYYSIKGKEPVEVGKEKQVFAIADDAKYIYYADADRIYAQKKKKDGEKLASEVSEVMALFNADMSEMLYVNSDTSYWFDDDDADRRTYLSVKAGEKEKVSNETVYGVILPNDAMEGYYRVDTAKGDVAVYMTGVETFEEQLFNTTGGIEFMNKKGEMIEVAGSARSLAMADDGESFVYANYSGDIFEVTKFKKGGEEKKIGDDVEAEEVFAAGDLKYVYYINADDELCCIKGKKDKKLADDVTSAAVSEDGTMCYYVIENEELCYSKKNGKKKEIHTEDEGGVSVDSAYGIVVVDVSNEDIEAGYIMDGKKMKEIFVKED